MSAVNNCNTDPEEVCDEVIEENDCLRFVCEINTEEVNNGMRDDSIPKDLYVSLENEVQITLFNGKDFLDNNLTQNPSVSLDAELECQDMKEEECPSKKPQSGRFGSVEVIIPPEKEINERVLFGDKD